MSEFFSDEFRPPEQMDTVTFQSVIEKLEEMVRSELPHIKHVIDSLEAQGLSSGVLPEIYGNLCQALEAKE